MNIRDARQEIIHTIKAYTSKNADGSYRIPLLRQRPLLLIGPPGIGKTAVMEQAAAACGVGFVSYTMTHHTRQSAMGLPFIEHHNFNGRDYAITEYTMSEIIASVYQCMEETGVREGLLFLDEINCVSETLAPAMLQFLQTKMFGSHRLPEGWVLAAAGNPPEYNKSVREFDIATLDRLKYITIEADYQAWRAYALEMNVHSAILAYLDTRPEQFYLLKQSYTNKAFVTARGWEDLSCLLLEYENLNLPVTAELIAQYLRHEELAQDFAGFYYLFSQRQKALPVADMLSGKKDGQSICSEWMNQAVFSEKLYLVHLMLAHIGSHLLDWKKSISNQNVLKSVIERLMNYQKQEHISSMAAAIPAFLEKERNILQIRREHGLSNETELQQLQQTLYLIQNLGYRMKADESQTESEQTDSLIQDLSAITESRIRELISMLYNSYSLLVESDQACYTFFLSALQQNTLAREFVDKYVPEIKKESNERLDFHSRESELKQVLSKSSF